MKKLDKVKIIKLIALILAVVLCLTLVIVINKKLENKNNEGGLLDNYDENDFSYDKDKATYITFDGTSATCDSDNVEISDGTTKIKSEGIYVLTGNYTGSVIVQTNQKVRIILSNVSISSSDGPAIYVVNAKKTYITLDENTENKLEDSTNYTDQEATATIYSKDDLIFNGNGSLVLAGNYQDGIISKDDLKIISGTYNITAMNNGIKGKDSVQIENPDITINAQNDGIKSTNSEDEEKGFVKINGGKITINSEHDGIQAENYIEISDGKINITTGGGSQNSTKTEKQDSMFIRGKSVPMQEAQKIESEDASDTGSYKGIKAQKNIVISGGTLNIDSKDDSIHSNSKITIENGTFQINSGDDGIHADDTLIINSGTIDVNKSYEGLEASVIEINDGDIKVNSQDDGINVAGGNDSSNENGGFQPDNFKQQSDSNNKLTINGGTIYVNASGDGLDANGSIYINGGTVYVDGPESDGDGALDYDNECVVNGGTLIAVGSTGMAQAISESSTVYCLNAAVTQSSGKKITITDSDSNTVLEYTPSKTYSSIVIATSEFQKGQTYNLNIDGSNYSSFTISSIVNNVGNTSNNFGPGNMKNGPFNGRQR